MELQLIHADSNFCELRELDKFNLFDAVITTEPDREKNDWMLDLPEKLWAELPIECGHYLYINGTEWGGPVERVRHDSSDGTVQVYGTCWRGLLAGKAVCPEEGQTHVVIASMEANSAIALLVGGWQGELISVSGEQSDIVCTADVRYKTLLEAVSNMLEQADGRLRVTFAGNTVELKAERARDRSGEVELSQEYEAHIVADERARVYNHIVALGRGEMLERTVVQMWVLPDGSITEDGASEGLPQENELMTYIYDYSAVEDEAELLSAAKKKLKELASENKMEIELNGGDTELELADVVAVRDSVTGMVARLSVVEKNLSIAPSGSSVRHKLA